MGPVVFFDAFKHDWTHRMPVHHVMLGTIWQLATWGLCAIMMYGARSLRRFQRYHLCVAATVIAMVPWSPHVLIGLPVGIMILLTLAKPSVRQAFQATAQAPEPPAPAVPPPQPTGFIRRRARSMIRGFGTLFFDSYPVAPGQEHDPRQLETTLQPVHVTPPPPAVPAPLSPAPVIIQVEAPRRRSSLAAGLFVLLLMLAGCLAFLLLVYAMSYRPRMDSAIVEEAKAVTPAIPQRVRTLDPDQAIDDFLFPLKLTPDRWEKARKVMKENYQEYLELEEKYREVHLDPQTGRLNLIIRAFGPDADGFRKAFYSRLDPLLNKEQLRYGHQKNIDRLRALFPNLEATTTVAIWSEGQWYHWTFTRDAQSGSSVNNVRDAGQDAQLPADLKRFWAMRAEAEERPEAIKNVQPRRDGKQR
jgi:hypothetical protein